jgi:hypothetical protein
MLNDAQLRIAWLDACFTVSVLPLCVAVAWPDVTNPPGAVNPGVGFFPAGAQLPTEQGTGSVTARLTLPQSMLAAIAIPAIAATDNLRSAPRRK